MKTVMKWSPVLIALLGIAASLFVWQHLRQRERAPMRRHLLDEVGKAIDLIADQFAVRMDATLALCVDLHLDSENQDKAVALTNTFQQAFPECRALRIISDNFSESYDLLNTALMTEVMGNRAVSQEQFREVLRKARETGRLQCSKTFKVNGTDVYQFVCIPFSGENQIKHYAVAIMDFSALITKLAEQWGDKLSLMIEEDGDVIYQQFLVGQPESVAKEAIGHALPETPWVFVFSPTRPFLNQHLSLTPVWVASVGVMLTLLLTIFAAVALASERHTEQLKRLTRRLRHEAHERRTAEDDILDKQRHLSFVVEAASDAIVSFDAMGEITFLNRAAELLLSARFDVEKTLSIAGFIPALDPITHPSLHKRLGSIPLLELTKMGGNVVEAVDSQGKEMALEVSLSCAEHPEGRMFTAILRPANLIGEHLEYMHWLIDALPQAICYIDGSLTVRFANHTALNTFRVKPQFILERTLSQLLSPEQFESLQPYIERVRQGEKVRLFERFKLRRRQLDLDIIFLPESGEREISHGFYAVMTDITSYKEVEEALRQSEERFQLVMQASEDAIYDYHLLEDRIWHNKAYKDVFNPEVNTEGRYSWWKDNLHPEDCDRVLKEISLGCRRGERYLKLDYRLRRADGNWAEVIDSCQIVRNEQGTPYRFVGALNDITALKEASARLRHREQIYQRAIRNLPGIAYELAFEPGTLLGEYRFIDRNIEELVGIPYDEFSQAKLLDMIDDSVIAVPHFDGDFREYLEAFLNREVSVYYADYRIRTPQGEVKWLSDHSVPIINEETGRTCGALGILQDVTLRKYLEGKHLNIDGELPESAQPSQKHAPGYKLPMKVLMAEDEEALRDLNRRLLEHAGFEVVSACDGQEAYDLYQKSPNGFDVVMLDLTMPRMDGLQAMLAMRVINDEQRFLFNSGIAREDLAESLPEEPGIEYLQKPYTPDDLEQTILKLQQSRQQPTQ